MGPIEGPQCGPSDRRRFARLVLRAQRMIGSQLGRDLYSNPGWDMLLELYLRERREPISLTSLSNASNAPERTGLRSIERLVRRGLVSRSRDETDGRRIHVVLTPVAIELLDCLLDALMTFPDQI
jgi:DNA-binding MarR family transcriptional regulator